MAAPRAPSIGILSTFPPTECGIATFSAALASGLVAHGATVDVVRCGDSEDFEDPLVVESTGPGGPRGVRAAVDALNRVDVAIVQHEYGIYGGLDGDDVVGVLRALSVPSIVVAHTVVRHPTSHQTVRAGGRCQAADAVVVMTDYARRRLIDRSISTPGRFGDPPRRDDAAVTTPDLRSAVPAIRCGC